LTGNSDNELGNPGEPPVPADVPSPEGEPLYRPLRGWASAYQPEPSLWSKIGALFSRKKREPEPTTELEEPIPFESSEVLDDEVEASDSDAFDEAFSAPRSELAPPRLSDPAFFVPEDEAPAEPAAPVSEIPPPVRDYQLRSGEEVEDLPVVREYHLRSEDVEEISGSDPVEEARDEPQFIPARSLLDDEPEPKKPGFFARLFGFGRKKAPQAEVPVLEEQFVAEPVAAELEEASVDAEATPEIEAAAEPEVVEADLVEPEPFEPEPFEPEPIEPEPVESEAFEEVVDVASPEPPAAPRRLDRPSIEFFMRVDRAADAEVPVPSLDEALPTDIDPAATDAENADLIAASANPFTEVPTDPWIPAVPETPVSVKQPGFLARIFGRKSKSQPVQEPVAEPEIAADANVDAFAAFDEPLQEPVAAEQFASVDDALPVDDSAVVDSVAEPVAAAPTDDWSRFAPPEPEPELAADARSTLEVESFTGLEVEPPSPVSDARSTLEMEAVPEPPAASTWDGNMVDLDVTMQEPVAADDGRSTVQVATVVEDVTTGEMVPPTPPEVTAAMEAERPPFFVPKFRAFYNEIVSHKQQKAEFTAGFATAVMDYTADLSPDAAAQQLQKRLCEILELQAAEATWMGGEAAARFPDAQYAMAALADEVFAHLEWGGRDAWPRHMVEQRLFKSNAKDVEFFKRVDKLLKNEADKPSAAARDLARMYLLVLAAGFEGKYRPFGLTRPLAEYRRRLYEFVSGKDPLEIYAEERKLFPEAADRVVVGRAVSRFSMLQQWAAVLVILLIGYAVISQMAWNRVSADLKDVTARVEAANSSATSDGLAGDPR
jgi:type IV/VI secretion system ImpK/VasF family protein